MLLIFLLLFRWMNLTGLVRAEFLRGRNLEYVRAARALGVSDITVMWRHILPNAMVATLTYLPFILSGSVTSAVDAGFSRLRPAAGIALARRTGGAGQEQPAGTVARVHRVLRAGRRADTADLRRRGGARRIRSAAVAGMKARRGPAMIIDSGRPRNEPGRGRKPVRRLRREARGRWRVVHASTAARPWRWSANPVPASRSPRCRCCSFCRQAAATPPAASC